MAQGNSWLNSIAAGFTSLTIARRRVEEGGEPIVPALSGLWSTQDHQGTTAGPPYATELPGATGDQAWVTGDPLISNVSSHAHVTAVGLPCPGS